MTFPWMLFSGWLLCMAALLASSDGDWGLAGILAVGSALCFVLEGNQ